jgi:hypothetical protein
MSKSDKERKAQNPFELLGQMYPKERKQEKKPEK